MYIWNADIGMHMLCPRHSLLGVSVMYWKFHNIVTYIDYVSQVENSRIFPIIKSLNQTLILQKWSEVFIGIRALFAFHEN
jgi:hypothetical protein